LKAKILVAMPAYNEAKRIAPVIRALRKEGYSDILVVDDCSKDDTAHIAKKEGAIVVRHKFNLGAGGATRTCIKEAELRGYDRCVLIDSDGQHAPSDIARLLKHHEDVIIGSRMIDPKGMPLMRKLLNFGGSIYTFLLFGIYVQDTQSGFKVLNKKALREIRITQERFEFSSEMIWQIKKKNLTYKEVPIQVIYTQDTLSKGQSLPNAFRMAFRMLKLRLNL